MDHSHFVGHLEPVLAEYGTTFAKFLEGAAVEKLMRIRRGPPALKLVPRRTPLVQTKKGQKSKKKPKRVIQHDLQVQNVTKLAKTDIVFGRGNLVSRYPGNWLFRQCIAVNKAAYAAMYKEDKGKAADALIWHFEQVGARFLEDAGDGSYSFVDYRRVNEKFCQGLREKKYSYSGLVPSVVSKIKAEGGKHMVSETLTKRIMKPEKASRSNAERARTARSYTEKYSDDSEWVEKPTKGKITKKATGSTVRAKFEKKKKRKGGTLVTASEAKLARTAKGTGKVAPASKVPTTKKKPPATPVHQLMVSPSAVVAPPSHGLMESRSAPVTPPHDVATVSLGSKDSAGNPGLLYQYPGNVKSTGLATSSGQKKAEEAAILRAFRQSHLASAMYARETMKHQWHAAEEAFAADADAEELGRVLRPLKLQKQKSGAVVPLPLFHDH